LHLIHLFYNLLSFWLHDYHHLLILFWHVLIQVLVFTSIQRYVRFQFKFLNRLYLANNLIFLPFELGQFGYTHLFSFLNFLVVYLFHLQSSNVKAIQVYMVKLFFIYWLSLLLCLSYQSKIFKILFNFFIVQLQFLLLFLSQFFRSLLIAFRKIFLPLDTWQIVSLIR
jgi:hypothetical protein